jgi:hypothetical protein
MKSIRDLWMAMTGRAESGTPRPPVIVHDPEKPHDLDDPFHDSDVQTRIAGVIAENAAKGLAHRKG